MRRCVGLIALLMPVAVQAACPPGTVARGVYTKYCYPVATGGGAGGGGYNSAGAQLGQQMGLVLGTFMRDALFGTAQQQAEQQAALAAQRKREEEERQRLAAQRAREDEKRYQQLRASLFGFESAPLSVTGTQRPGGGLQLLLGEEAERSASPAMAQLSRAAAWSTLAARADTPERAAMLADAAFQSALGEEVRLPPPPPDVRGVPVGPIVNDFEVRKREYLELRNGLPDIVKPVLDAEYRRELAAHAEEEAQGAERVAQDAKARAQARAAAKEAQRMRQQAEEDLALARARLQQMQSTLNGVEKTLRDLVGSMARREGGSPGSSDAYNKGYLDATLCFSQSAVSYCQQAPAEAAAACQGTYRQGHMAGQKVTEQLFQDARERGKQDKLAGRNYAITDPKAQGTCRYEYVMAYNTGYFTTRLSAVASIEPITRTDVAPVPPAARRPQTENNRMSDQMAAYARQAGMSAEAQAELRDALGKLKLTAAQYRAMGVDPDSFDTYEVSRAWQRGHEALSDPEFIRSIARAEGRNLASAGTQGSNDCVVYALASMTGRPYSAVAAHATKVVREASWRSDEDRANPQGAIETRGLLAGEAVLLAKMLGEVQLVSPTRFAEVVRSGRPVTVGVASSNPRSAMGHQILLTRTFKHDGVNWFEIIDSNRGLAQRVYMREPDLYQLIEHNGVAYTPPKGSTPALLR